MEKEINTLRTSLEKECPEPAVLTEITSEALLKFVASLEGELKQTADKNRKLTERKQRRANQKKMGELRKAIAHTKLRL